jgi:quinoprotein glucose dehydrogenase
MTAIDMNTGDHVWMVPLGKGSTVRNHAMLKHLDLPPLGGDSSPDSGPLLTRTLLISALTAGGRDDGPRLVARDKKTGEEVASLDLPGTALGAPMTYLIDGKQYIAVPVSGTPVPELVAFALP